MGSYVDNHTLGIKNVYTCPYLGKDSCVKLGERMPQHFVDEETCVIMLLDEYEAYWRYMNKCGNVFTLGDLVKMKIITPKTLESEFCDENNDIGQLDDKN